MFRFFHRLAFYILLFALFLCSPFVVHATAGSSADLDGNGEVDIFDYNQLVASFWKWIN